MSRARKNPLVALFPVDQQSREVLGDCFRQFSIDITPAYDTTIFQREKLEGCVVSLTTPGVESIVAEVRNSAWQKRMVIYAVGPSASIRDLTPHGINVLLHSPVGRPAALKAIHSTRLLLLNELRRYVRLPLATAIVLKHGLHHIAAISVEISAGGMSMLCKDRCPPPGATVYASFAVPGSAQLQIESLVCWSNDRTGECGLRYNLEAEGRQAVHAWIQTFLGFD